MSERMWYYAKDNQQQGPVPENQLRHLLASRTIPPDVLVWCDHLENWATAHSLPEFSSLFSAPASSPAPALAPVSAPAPAPTSAAPVATQEIAPASTGQSSPTYALDPKFFGGQVVDYSSSERTSLQDQTRQQPEPSSHQAYSQPTQARQQDPSGYQSHQPQPTQVRQQDPSGYQSDQPQPTQARQQDPSVYQSHQPQPTQVRQQDPSGYQSDQAQPTQARQQDPSGYQSYQPQPTQARQQAPSGYQSYQPQPTQSQQGPSGYPVQQSQTESRQPESHGYQQSQPASDYRQPEQAQYETHQAPPRPSLRSHQLQDDTPSGAEPARRFDPRHSMEEIAQNPEVRAFTNNFIEQVKALILSPKQFFESMPTSGGVAGPLSFFAACLGVYAVLIGLLSFNLIVPVILLILFPISLFIGSMIVNLIAKSLGGKGTFEGTLRVYCYSYVTLLAGWVPIAGLFVGFYSWYLIFLGFKKVHQLTTAQTIGVLAVVIILSVFLATLAACGAGIAAIIFAAASGS